MAGAFKEADWQATTHMLVLAYLDSQQPEAEDLIARFATAADHRAADRYRLPARRQQSVAAHALLRATLENETGCPENRWRFDRDPLGKPILRSDDGQAPIAVSLSHCRTMTACAIADPGPVGIDIEYCAPDRPFMDIATTAFGENEKRAVEIGGVAVFYRIWTLREALAKATGVGLPMVMNGRDYFALPQCSGAWRAEIEGRDWLFGAGTVAGTYALGLAVAVRPETWGSAAAQADPTAWTMTAGFPPRCLDATARLDPPRNA